MEKQKRAVIYARVSTGEQNLDNQIDKLKTMQSLQNYTLVHTYVDTTSGGSANRPDFQQMLEDARMRKFDIILVWSLDRFSREGINNTLAYLNKLKAHGVSIKSLQEPWLDTSESGMGDLLIAIFSWVAEQERKRISERTKAGLANAKNVGKRGKDKHPRNKAGYYRRWMKKKPMGR
ncbi:MAG: recombinase family protein [Actinobacteria bacterium]|jgi:DNA invertase Pin-like site-specific DNA recombinase|nr:recombinase family protein [Actinomycetota bacterium]MBE3122564.1 recombinase family protein [Thermoplasmata archaeon]